ncbi:alpha/beta hydrolase [Arthrobacter sp. GCM10027362]|uniref:alpha/beta hydrolase n=1 Tax=Arthrobacter sp. GCM10027362 TaxID=3273379 RepID=UPI0036399320
MPFYELTQWPLLALTLVFLAASVTVAVAVLPRHRGPGPGKYLLQAASIVMVTVLSIIALFLKLNADNQWYSSWADLLNGDIAGPAQTTVLGAPVKKVIREAPATSGRFTQLQSNPALNPDFGSQVKPKAAAGQWVSFTFTGPTTGISQDVAVWLPPSYLKHPRRAYPLITAFSGYPGSPATYIQTLHYDRTVQDQVSQGRLREPLVVVPDMFPANLDTECVDGSDGKYESYVAVDLVNWIRKNLRTVDNPQAWATTGYSAGGWCATMFSVLHPRQWASSINFAGYFAPDYSPHQRWNTVRDPRYNLGTVVARHRPAVAIWFFSGGDDRRPLRSLAAFEPQVSAPTSLVTNISEFGGHRLNIWRPQMGSSLAWLGSVSGYFAPP